MLGKLIPLAIGLAGLAGGVGAGVAFRPDPGAAAAVEKAAPDAHGTQHGGGTTSFIPMGQHFVVPVIEDGRVTALVAAGVTIEVVSVQEGIVSDRAPKLRDRLLRVMLDHANTGGFSGTFTSNTAMARLQRSLSDAAREEIGDALVDVLITDLNRQAS